MAYVYDFSIDEEGDIDIFYRGFSISMLSLI